MAQGSERSPEQLLLKPEKPHFFKIILDNTIENEKLVIPKRFVRKYGDELSGSVVLKIPDGTKWRVYLTKTDGQIWLSKGWKEFTLNYSLKFGHVLVFEYENRSCFNVVIFDKSATEIDYPCSGIDGEVGELEETGTVDTNISLNVCNYYGAKIEQSQLPCDLPDKRNGEIVARRINAGFISENPSFEVTIRPRHLKFPQLHLKFAFAELHLKENQGNVILQVKGGRSWTMGLTVSCHIKSAYFRTNWREFVDGNILKEGDNIKFELIDNKELVFDVTISRKTEDVLCDVPLGSSGSGNGAGRGKTLRSSSAEHLTVNCKTRKNKRLKDNASNKLPPPSSPTPSRSLVLALASLSVRKQKKERKPVSPPILALASLRVR